MKYPLTPEEASILAHTSTNGRYVGEGHALMALAARGLLHDHGPQTLAGGAHYLTTTMEGRDALNEWREAQPKPPKPKRRSKHFEAWRSYCEANGSLKFSEFLKRLKEGHYEGIVV
jgi:hypothetical protein